MLHATAGSGQYTTAGSGLFTTAGSGLYETAGLYKAASSSLLQTKAGRGLCNVNFKVLKSNLLSK